MIKTDLKSTEYDVYYKRYIDKLPDTIGLIESFSAGKELTIDFFSKVPDNKLMYKYQPEKWSVKEVFQHLIDTERIFMYRCFRIARRDETALAGFDQNIYVQPSNANHKTIDELISEFEISRMNSIQLLKSLQNTDLCFIGNSNQSKISARAAAFVIPGHNIWHIETIKNKYL